jgi:hypothetical protein
MGGVLTIRMPESLQLRLREKAHRNKKSLNIMCRELLEAMVDGRVYLVGANGQKVHVWPVSADPAKWGAEVRAEWLRQSTQTTLALMDECEENQPNTIDSDCKSQSESLELATK